MTIYVFTSNPMLSGILEESGNAEEDFVIDIVVSLIECRDLQHGRTEVIVVTLTTTLNTVHVTSCVYLTTEIGVGFRNALVIVVHRKSSTFSVRRNAVG